MRGISTLRSGGTPTALRGRVAQRGFTVLEVTLSLVVLGSAALLLTQFLVASSRQQETANQRRIALEEVSNQMERALAAKYENVTVAAIEKQELSQSALEQLPGVQLTAIVSDEPGPPAARRIRLEISWEQGGDRVKPLGLTAWRYLPQEAQP